MSEKSTLSCKEGYKLVCMSKSESGGCCCFCLSVVSPEKKSSS